MLILSLVQFKIMEKCQKLLLFIKKCSFSIFVFDKYQLMTEKIRKQFQVKHLKFWQVYYHSRYFRQNVPTSVVKGDQKLTNEMSIH